MVFGLIPRANQISSPVPEVPVVLRNTTEKELDPLTFYLGSEVFISFVEMAACHVLLYCQVVNAASVCNVAVDRVKDI